MYIHFDMLFRLTPTMHWPSRPLYYSHLNIYRSCMYTNIIYRKDKTTIHRKYKLQYNLSQTEVQCIALHYNIPYWAGQFQLAQQMGQRQHRAPSPAQRKQYDSVRQCLIGPPRRYHCPLGNFLYNGKWATCIYLYAQCIINFFGICYSNWQKLI